MSIIVKRIILAVFLSAMITLIVAPIRAQNFPWCAIMDNDGITQCIYYTPQQCLDALRGAGAQCVQSPGGDVPKLAPMTPVKEPSSGPIQFPPALDEAPSTNAALAAGVHPNNLFTAAGFIVKYATTPEKHGLLASLPQDKLIKRTKDGTVYYVYADVARCNCAYIGTAQAYAAYQNWANGPNFGGNDQASNAMQIINTDISPPDITTDILPGIDRILYPEF